MRIDELDSVVIIRIMACGNHNSAVEPVYSCNVSNRGRSRNVQHIRIGAGCSKPRDNRIFEHITRPARILADYYARRGCIAVAAFQFAEIPTQKSAHAISVFSRQSFTRFSAEPVCSEISSHSCLYFLLAISFEFLYILSAGTAPLTEERGYTEEFLPKTVPGFKTLLQPTSAKSPIIAPTFLRFVA